MTARLTQMVACAGCASKLAAGDLSRLLGTIPTSPNPRVLVDFRTSDDAGVYAWEGGPALVQTVDFFTPIVDDPFTYGQIAAANAISDVYAMGGRPLTALAVAAFPKDGLEPGTIQAIFEGGYSKLAEAGIALLGGHTVQDPEIKFGYAVTGSIDPAHVLTNAGARPGDVLWLTKPLGTGVMATAMKFDRTTLDVAQPAIDSMRTLNRAAADALHALPPGVVHACTDVTGFGLAGHGSEMAAASGVTLSIDAAALPLFPHARALVLDNRSGGWHTNHQHFSRGVRIDAAVPADLAALLYDPQTSGGLLIAAAPDAAVLIDERLEQASVRAARVGAVSMADNDVKVRVR